LIYTNSGEFRLACAIIRGRAEMVEALASAQFCWQAFLQYAKSQRIAGCVFHAAREHSLVPLLQEQTAQSLRESYLTQWRWNLLLLDRIGEVDIAVRHNRRDVIVLKGPYLADEYFGRLGARHVGDIDLLIGDRRDLRVFEDVLGDLGYRRRSRIVGSRALTTRYTHHMEFDGTLVPLDLHWTLRQHPTFALHYPDMWQRKKRVRVHNVEFHVLDVEYQLVLQSLSIHTDIQVGILLLKSFIDLYAILKRVEGNFPWETFFARRAGERLLRISINVMDLFLEVLDCRDEFPGLTEAVRKHRSQLVFSDRDAKLALVLGPRNTFVRKQWGLRLYDSSPLRATLWWAFSLPFRLAEHRPLNPRRTLRDTHVR
jgi:hypothetical protein